MKKFYTSLIAFTFILTGCSFLDFLPKGEGGEKDPSKDTITSFDFVTDSKMVEETLSDGTTKYKVVELYIDETYQVKTDIDDKIGEDYYFTYSILTNVRPTALVNGNEVTGTYFEGPYNEIDTYNEVGKTYEVNSSSITIQNKYNGTLNHYSVLAIYSVLINYHIEKI